MLLAELARDRQWSSSDIKKLAGANLVRVFREVEKVGLSKGKSINLLIYLTPVTSLHFASTASESSPRIFQEEYHTITWNLII
jgi:hypothetical protein